MKNYIYLIFGMAILLTCCQNKEQVHNIQEQIIEQDPSDLVIPETSIFNIEDTWKNQYNENFQFKDLAGKPSIMAMIYTSCQFSCPRIVADMREIESLVPKEKVNDINFVLISIDPEVDQPDTLKSFMIKNDMEPSRWTLLTGSKEQIQDIAAVLGFKYKKSSLMDYAHSNLITEFDKKGNWLHQTEGFGNDKAEIVEVLIKAL